jgi:hypothetical protein
MSVISDNIRDAGQRLAALPAEQFANAIREAIAGHFQAFAVDPAMIRDKAGNQVAADLVIATALIDDGEVMADSVAVAAFLCSSLDAKTLREGYEWTAKVKALQKIASAEDSRSTVTLCVIAAGTSQLSLDGLAAEMQKLNGGVSDEHRPDMVAVLSRGTINYLVTFGPDQTTPGDWLPPAQGKRQFVAPTLLHMITTATTAFALNRLVGYIIGQLAFFAPTIGRPDVQAVIEGVPAHRAVATMYQYDLSGKLVEIEKPEDVVTLPFLIEGPNKELLAKMFFQPWQDGGVVILDGLLPLEGLLVFAPKQVPFVATKLPGDRQVSAVLPLTFDEFVTLAEQIGMRSNMTTRRQQQEWAIAHMANEGSSTPFVARLWMTPPNLRNTVLAGKEETEKFDAIFGSTLNDLVTLRRIGKETIDLWNAHAKKVDSGEIVRYDNAIHVDETIGEPLSHNLETIIRNAANTAKQFQELTKLFGLDVGCMFKDDKGFEDGLKALEASDPMLTDYLRETRKWLQPLTLTRNDLEHKPYTAPRLQYIRSAGDRFQIKEPTVLGLPMTHFVSATMSRLNRFIEELLIRAMQGVMLSPLTIVEVPIGKRDPLKPERFKLGVIGREQPWQIMFSDDEFDRV